MFRKLLIANRGEIACRIISTARRMGVATVAVYSDADAQAPHVALADEALRIGPAPVSESYLKTDAILEAARRTGAEAIHPGYGFLSENPEFVEAVEAAGLTFVGPPPAAIRAMGLKDNAKRLMETAGVPVVPGYHGADQDPDTLASEAARIGYPVLIKARAGGGGKGMRLVEGPDAFSEALASAQREAAAAFGDAACLVEKFITAPRHIEIQIMADAHGNVVHLFERDCSLQRRHQKVIEEAPAPGMTAEVREAMGHAAVEAARAIGYQGAGTVEFVVDGSGDLRTDGFWFMEMNTRLQVEHPVSEAITGLDFVELQLRVAAGEKLGITQEALTIDGHAFEARVYAEDATKGFLPSTGWVSHLAFPDAVRFATGPVRVDSGVAQGSEITPYYDPMIAKLIVHGPTRQAALARLEAALCHCQVAGVTTNIGFLLALAQHEGFAAGNVDTGLIDRDFDALTTQPQAGAHAIALASVLALDLLSECGNGPWDQVSGWRAWGHGTATIRMRLGEADLEQSVTFQGNQSFKLEGAANVNCAVSRTGASDFAVVIDGMRQTLQAVKTGKEVIVFQSGATHRFQVPDPLEVASEDARSGDVLIAPMPGLVRLVSASAGEQVSKGDPLLVLEAMKMEHTLRAPRDGTVEAVLTEAGAQVSDGAILLRLEEVEDA